MHRRSAITATHLQRRLQAATTRRPFWLTKNRTAHIVHQLHAWHTRRLAMRHAGNWAGDGRRGTTSAALGTALHGAGNQGETSSALYPPRDLCLPPPKPTI